MKRGAVVLLVALLASALAGCGGKDEPAEDDLRDAINRTERLSRTFVYEEKSGGTTYEVRGLIEDDFRSKARLTVDGEEAFDQVESDDALAVRFLDTSRLRDMIDRPATLSDEPDERDAVDPIEALRTHRWVLDEAGAPPLLAGDEIDRELGDDPVLDALDVFTYLRSAIGGARQVIKFNVDSLDYKPFEDPFPHPEKGVVRYDLERPSLPKPTAIRGANSGPALPGIIHIRKLSVYVKDGLIIRVLEQIDPDERLDEIIDDAANYLRDVNASDEAIHRVQALKGAPPAEAAQAVIAGVNLFRQQSGDDPIRLRTMRLEIGDLGDDVDVALPTDYITADLELLKYRGRDAAEPKGANA